MMPGRGRGFLRRSLPVRDDDGVDKVPVLVRDLLRVEVDVFEVPRQTDIAGYEIFLELFARGNQPALRVQDHAVTVEDELILSADRVGVDDVGIVLPCAPGEHLQALFALALVIRRGVDRDDDLGACAALGPGGAVSEPDVLADVHTDVDAPDRDDGIPLARFEVAVLVKDPVVRKKHFVIHMDEPAVMHDRRRVGDAFVGVHEPDDRRDPPRLSGDLLERAQVVLHELRFEQQVLGRIAGDGELRKYDNVGAELPRASDVVDDLVPVAREVAHRGVYLGQGNAESSHDFSSSL